MKASFNLRSSDPAFRLALVQTASPVPIEAMVKVLLNRSLPAQTDLERAIRWVKEHLPNEDGGADDIVINEPPNLSLLCPLSMTRIEVAARGVNCDHLQSFDLASFVETMKLAPPKRKWVCPICDVVCLPDRMVLDSFAQQILRSAAANVTEVLISTDGRWTVSMTEDSDDFSGDEMMIRVMKPQADMIILRPIEGGPTAGGGRTNGGRAGGVATGTDRRGSPDETPPPKRQKLDAAQQAWEEQKRLKQEEKRRKEVEKQEREERERRKKEWERIQYGRYGFMEEGDECTKCNKKVQQRGGVICARDTKILTNQTGCDKMYCWKCMKGEKPRTTKAECEEMGEDCWWMHEACMSEADKKA